MTSMHAAGASAAGRGHVLVCGGGLAGHVAAVSACEAGARVTLIDKAPQLGGSTAISGGILWTYADYDRLRGDIPHGNALLQWHVVDGLDAAASWLFAHGVNGGPEEAFFDVGRGWRVEPAQALVVLAERLRALGGDVRTQCALESLTVERAAIGGARCIADDEIVDIAADAVVLATGGFQGNAELLARYVVRDATHVALRASPWSTGDGMIAATAVGGAHSAGLDKFYGHALCALPATSGPVDFRALSQFYGPSSVAVNLRGRRFCDESEGPEELLNYRLAHEPSGRGFYIVDEAMVALRPMPGLDLVTSAIIERARSAGANVARGASIDALSQALAQQGVPAAALRRELEGFNAAMAGDADALSPPRRANRRPLVPPLQAVPVQASITFTMGGLAVDEHGRVLRRAASSAIGQDLPPERAHVDAGAAPIAFEGYRESVVHGLYAAGCDAGNVHHRGYLGGLAAGLVIGRAAGRHAAAYAQRRCERP